MNFTPVPLPAASGTVVILRSAGVKCPAAATAQVVPFVDVSTL